jgi:hypothetical protein
MAVDPQTAAQAAGRTSSAHSGMPMPSLGTDYYHVDELLTDEERSIRDRVREFSDREVVPIHQ